MKIVQSWKRNIPSPDGYSLTVTYVYSSERLSEIEAIEKKLPDGMLVFDTAGHETSDTRESRIFQCKECGYGIEDIFLNSEHDYPIIPRYCPNCGRQVNKDEGSAND